MDLSPQEEALREAMQKCEIMTVVDHLVSYIGATALSAVRAGDDPDSVFATIRDGLRVSIDYSVNALQPAWYANAELLRVEAHWDSAQ